MEQIVRNVQNLLDDDIAYHEMARAQNPFGDGRAAQRIVDILVQDFGDAA